MAVCVQSCRGAFFVFSHRTWKFIATLLGHRRLSNGACAALFGDIGACLHDGRGPAVHADVSAWVGRFRGGKSTDWKIQRNFNNYKARRAGVTADSRNNQAGGGGNGTQSSWPCTAF
eukprot:1539872-Pyramimonas_sp.AAC.1